jgi:serine/threonine protein phosphatase PrpC
VRELDGQEEVVRIDVGAATDAGGREANEDAVYVAPLPPLPTDTDGITPGFLMAVADGMGGYRHGEVASRTAIDSVGRVFVDEPSTDSALVMKRAFRRANEVIFTESQSTGEPGTMGTTLVVAATRGKYATIANVGDSRAYLVRANRLTQITKDHSLVAEQVAQGALSPTEARQSPQRNVLTQALGLRDRLETKLPGIFELTLLPEDRLLLCTDGFYDVVSDDDMLAILLDQPAETAAQSLVSLAVERGTTDNVSAVVAQVLPTRAPVTRELVTAGAGGGPGAYLIPALVTLAAIIFIAIVVLVLLTAR